MTLALELEILSRGPETSEKPPLLFLHGSYCGAWVWDEFFLPYFAEKGYSCFAVSLRGHGQSEGREGLREASLADFVTDLETAVTRIGQAPVILAHSMGGMITQKFLERARERWRIPGVVFLAPGSPYGLMTSASWMMVRRPWFLWQLNLFQATGQEGLFLDACMKELFSARLPKEALRRYLPLVQRESERVILDLMLPDLPRLRREEFPPALVLAGDQDVFFPASEFARTARCYFAELQIVPGANHMLMLDEGWPEIAGRIREWLEREVIPRVSPRESLPVETG